MIVSRALSVLAARPPRALAALAFVAAFALQACSPGPDGAPSGTKEATGPANPVVVIETTKGTIEVELFPKEAPATVENFLEYVDSGHYDGTIFHRVIKDFMIQGGGFTPDGQQKPNRPPVRNEANNGLKNERGTIAMARTAVVDSATSQFFLNHADNAFLDHKSESPQGFGYCVFGKVVAGLDVVDAIANAPKGDRPPGVFENRPREDVLIQSIRKKG